MFSIRDSAEPEDSFSQDRDIFPPSPGRPALTPIIFDLPSTTTEPSSTSIPTQKQTPARQTPHRAELHSTSGITPRERSTEKRRKTNNSLSAVEDVSNRVWDFEVSPARSRRARTMGEAEDMGKKGRRNGSVKSPATREGTISVNDIDEHISRRTRRNSITGEHVTRGRGSIVEEEEEEEVVASKSRKRSSRYIEVEESDAEGGNDDVDEAVEGEDVGQDLAETQQTDIIAEDEEQQETIPVRSTSRKRFTNIIVEIPPRPSRNKKSRRQTLEEIPFQNTNADILNTPETSPEKLLPVASRHITPATIANEPAPSQDLENVVLANVPTAPKANSSKNALDKEATEQTQIMTPTKSTGIAKILAKSPNRPMYRVGLSRRVNVEPLHGYLKRSGSSAGRS